VYNHRRRLEKAEKQLCVNEPPVVFEYTDENGVEQRAEMSSADFDRLLREISAESKGLPVREGAAV
jgi:hypothetical protein